jgi:hypothetical protein
MSAGAYEPVIHVYNRGGGFTCAFEVRAKLAGDTMSYSVPAGYSAYVQLREWFAFANRRTLLG